jgi:hypothetical protein
MLFGLEQVEKLDIASRNQTCRLLPFDSLLAFCNLASKYSRLRLESEQISSKRSDI